VPEGAIRDLRLDYRDDGVVAVVELHVEPAEGVQARVAERLRQAGSDLSEIRLLWAPP